VIHSQEEKAVRLEYLVKHLLQKKFKNHVLDIHYVIISLFLQISRNPLENKFFNKKTRNYSPEKKFSKDNVAFQDKNYEIQQVKFSLCFLSY